MSRSKQIAFAAAFVIALTPTACALGDGACLRMSDCEAPFTCVEGTCRSNETLELGGDGGFVEVSDQ